MTRKQDQQIKLLDQILDKVQPTLRKDCNYRYFPSDTVFKTFYDILNLPNHETLLPATWRKSGQKHLGAKRGKVGGCRISLCRRPSCRQQVKVVNVHGNDVNVAKSPFGESGCCSMFHESGQCVSAAHEMHSPTM